LAHRDEIQRLHLACLASRKESEELIEERDKLVGDKGKVKQSLIKQISEIEVKIKKQLVIIDDKKKTIEKDKVIGDLSAITSLASAENILKGHVEQAEELRSRLNSGVLPPDAQSRLLDIQVRCCSRH
jgi:hypothetical protein